MPAPANTPRQRPPPRRSARVPAATRAWRRLVRGVLALATAGAAVALFGWLGPLQAPSPEPDVGTAAAPVSLATWRTPAPGFSPAPGSTSPPTAAQPAAAANPAVATATQDSAMPQPGAAAASNAYRARAGLGRGAPPAAGPTLPVMPGAQALADDTGQDPASNNGQWTATLSSRAPLQQVVAYYRNQLQQRAQAGDPPMEDLSPGPGQHLLSQVNLASQERHAVWVGTGGEGELTIRLVRVRTQP